MSNSLGSEELSNLTLITGGARSGKSALAESIAESQSEPVVYIATMENVQTDAEVGLRISKHRQRRPKHWQTVEQPLAVHDAIDGITEQSAVCIFDCLSLYLSNVILQDYDESTSFEVLEDKVQLVLNLLVQSIRCKPNTRFIMVTNEVGWGIVPENALARAYRDLLGAANQRLASLSSAVWLCCVGLKIALK